jgi:hypothetical protein
MKQLFHVPNFKTLSEEVPFEDVDKEGDFVNGITSKTQVSLFLLMVIVD